MIKYQHQNYTAPNGKEYVFVTRGKSAPFSAEEINNYMKEVAKDVTLPVEAVQVEPKQAVARKLTIGDHLENIFLADLKTGLEFCKSKYGVDENEIVSEAARVFPSLNLKKLWEKPNGDKRTT